ncbi:hypothetical protein LIER_22213 [Lithospermum erythrorhizon]|uniref:Reverse transcriptase zinc-binding domain-containing protein n=1 Tax=Lithospermum erythrorhizon TaxID=34254 RepID=A0AAV3QVJ7_LITER
MDFWDAMVGCSPSFIYKSILQSREVLRRGCRWILSDGNTIRMWQDTWVQGDSVEKLISPAPLGFEHARVVVLMDIEGKRWDVDVVRSLLLPCEAELVLKIPFPAFDYPDRAVWRDSPGGKFEVKSAFLLACRMTREKDLLPMSSSPPSGFWKYLLKWKLPPKVRHFLWRLYTNSLPTELGMPAFPHDFICPMDLLEFGASVLRGEDVRQLRQVVEFARNFLARFVQADRLINVECCIE